MIPRRLFSTLVVALSALVLVACNGGGGGTASMPQGSIRVVHASPDAPDVDVYVNGDLVLPGVTYQAASAFLDIAAGDVQVDIRVAGSTGAPVLSGSVPLTQGQALTLLAVDVVARLSLLVVEEDRSTVTTGNARVNVVHASPNAGNVDLFVTAPSAPLGTPTIGDVPFQADAALGEVLAGNYQVRATAVGSPMVAYDSGTLALAGGDNLTVVAVDSVKGLSPVSLVLLTGTATNPVVLDDSIEVRVLHAVPDVPTVGGAVDVYVNGGLAIEDFLYKQSTTSLGAGDAKGYLKLPSNVDVDITLPNDIIANAVISDSLMLERGEAYTLVATGSVTDVTIGLNLLGLADDRDASTDATMGRVRVVHTAPFASGVGADVDLYAGPQGVTMTSDVGVSLVQAGIAFEAETGYLDLANGNYTALVTPAMAPALVAISADFTVAADTVASAFAVGDNAGQPLEILLFDDSR